MATYRLNLPALRRASNPQSQQSQTITRQSAADQLTMSRREVLGMAGVAAIGMSSVARAVESSVIGPFDCVVRGGRVSFRLSGVDRWVIDTRRFTGSPDLSVTKTDGLIKIKLSNARYPGTNLPADLTCDLQRGLLGWRMNLKMKLGGFRADVPFDRWLTGRETAKSIVDLDNSVCGLDSHSSLKMNGKAEAIFSPDWTLSISGHHVALLRIGDQQTLADSLHLSQLSAQDPSLVTKPAPRRSLVVLRPGSAKWAPDLFLDELPDHWRRSAPSCAFDAISLELGVHKTGLPQRTLLAESVNDETRLHVEPLDAGATKKPFSLPLRNLRYSTTFGKTENHTALLARYGNEPAWLHVDGCSLQLGDSPHTADMEITRLGQKQQIVSCAPALLALVAPLIGAVTDTAHATRPTHVNVGAMPRPGATVGKTTGPVKADLGAVVSKPSGQLIAMLPNIRVPVVRPSDLLCLEFEFINLRYSNATPPSLVRADSKKPAFIVVHFPPQNIAERAFFETAPSSKDNEEPTSDPVPTVMAGPSRLVFRVPDKTNEVPYRLDALLDWRRYEPSLAMVAQPPAESIAEKVAHMSPAVGTLEIGPHFVTRSASARPQINALASHSYVNTAPSIGHDYGNAVAGTAVASMMEITEPADSETSIEAPYRLMLSPHAGEGWAHSQAAVTLGGRTELWHTRLGMRNADGTVDETESPYRTLRAIWSPDYNPKNPPNSADLTPFRTGITRWQRHQIVGLTSTFTTSSYEPLPIQAKKFMLTSLGAWIDTHGTWNPKKLMFNVSEWKHTATMGRDHYVKIVEIGYLFPFGHPAVKTTVTERKFQLVGKRIEAVLRQVMYITVLKPVVEYPIPGAPEMVYELPFKRIQCVTTVTPDLGKPESSAVPGTGIDAFWPMYGNSDFKFHFVGEDWEHHQAEFELPVIFVAFSAAFNALKTNAIHGEYFKDQNKERRKTYFKGQRIAYAESSKPGDTSYETHEARIGAKVLDFQKNGSLLEKMEQDDKPPFYPVLLDAAVVLAQLQNLVGNASPVTITYSDTYRAQGMGSANKGEVFAKLENPIDLSFGGSPDKSCGVAAPNMSIGGISRGFGPVGGSAEAIATGSFDPSSFFKDAMILGSIPLSSILNTLHDFGSAQAAANEIPRLSSRPIYPAGQSMPSAMETTLTWETSEIKNDDSGTFVANNNGQQCSLAISAMKRTALDGTDSTQTISGQLSNFTVALVPKIMSLAEIRFNHLRFSCENGKKPDVKADIAKVTFLGPLEFINPLEEFLGGNNFSDPPYLDVDSSHVEAGFTLAIPSVGIGVFSLQNINLAAALRVPFVGDPVSMRFGFCERQNPFMLTVSLFAGGGYFGLEVDPNGIKTVEGSIEFGGSFSLNLGVASGGVYVMAGVSYSRTGDQTALGGYLRCGGALEVLGLITVSLEFMMTLEHISNPSRLHGIATLTVEVEVLFFSKSVDLTVEREFGGGGDPGFKDLMAEADWSDYCDAFAA